MVIFVAALLLLVERSVKFCCALMSRETGTRSYPATSSILFFWCVLILQPTVFFWGLNLVSTTSLRRMLANWRVGQFSSKSLFKGYSIACVHDVSSVPLFENVSDRYRKPVVGTVLYSRPCPIVCRAPEVDVSLVLIGRCPLDGLARRRITQKSKKTSYGTCTVVYPQGIGR
jgi:hypothetical protein